MKKFLYNIVGISFTLAAVIGILFSLLGIITVWRYVPLVSERLLDGAYFAQRALNSSESLLDIAESTLTNTEENVALISAAIQGMSDALGETSDMATSISDLFENKFMDVIENTQNALTSLENSAKLVDNTLSIIAAIPLIGTNYSNQTPLYNSVAEINDSLDDMPSDMQSLQENLGHTALAMQGLTENVDGLLENIQETQGDISSAKEIVKNYQSQVQEAKEKINYAIENIPHWVDGVAVLLTFFMIWLIFIQAGLLLMSWDRVGWHKSEKYNAKKE